MTRRLAAVALVLAATAAVRAQPPTIADFFDRFTADWIRSNPDQATSARYFTGDEQRNLERQLTPVTEAWSNSRRDLARRGLAELSRFDLSRVNKTDRLSAELMRWQLQVVVDGERFADYAFPFEQFQGVNVNLVNAFTVVHPLLTEADGENYVARLQLMPARLDEAIAEGRRIAAKGLIPPRFILNLTTAQMKQFADQPAYAERTAAESGWYEGDIEGRLGQLDAELFRARRLVVDTGIHAKHWTRQQGIDYGIEPSEVERYVVYPGQACAYMLGELKLIELRDRARTRLGDRFSFKDYHNAVLALGTLPLLEREVNAYIEERAK